MKQEPLNISVDEFVSPLSYYAKKETDVDSIFHAMKKNGYRHVPVVEGSKPVGIISERDIYLVTKVDTTENITAEQIMNSDPYCVQSGTPIDEVAYQMSDRKIGSAIVLNNHGEIDGIFTSTDGLNALIEIVRNQMDN